MANLIMLFAGGLIMVLFVAIGGFMIYYSLRSRKKAEASQTWPSINGQITESRVSHSTSTDSEGERSESYDPVVRYTYQIMGQTYTGKNIRFGAQTSYNNPGKAQAALEQFPVGGVVAVYYNPENPAESVLDRQAGGSTLVLVIGIVFLLVGFCLGLSFVVISLLAPLSSG